MGFFNEGFWGLDQSKLGRIGGRLKGWGEEVCWHSRKELLAQGVAVCLRPGIPQHCQTDYFTHVHTLAHQHKSTPCLCL